MTPDIKTRQNWGKYVTTRASHYPRRTCLFLGMLRKSQVPRLALNAVSESAARVLHLDYGATG